MRWKDEGCGVVRTSKELELGLKNRITKGINVGCLGRQANMARGDGESSSVVPLPWMGWGAQGEKEMRVYKLGAGGVVLWTALKDLARSATGRIGDLWSLCDTDQGTERWSWCCHQSSYEASARYVTPDVPCRYKCRQFFLLAYPHMLSKHILGTDTDKTM